MWGYDLPWLIGYTILIFIWVIPLLVLWSISFCFVRRKKDPARVGIVWMKIVYPLWLLSSFLYAVQAGLAIWYDQDIPDNYMYNPMLQVNLEQWQFHLGEVALLLARVADISLLITFIEIASGFILCLNQGKPAPSRKRLRYITFAFAFALFALSVILFSLRTSHFLGAFNAQRALGPYHQTDRPEIDWVARWNTYLMLWRFDRAQRFLIWIASLPTLVYVSYVTHQTRVNRLLRKFISPLLACAILNLLRLLTIAFWYPPEDLRYVSFIIIIVGSFVNYVVMFIILIILFCIGFRKSKGLWSTPQKWNTTMPSKINVITTAPGMSPYPPTTQEAIQQPQPQPGMTWQAQQQTRPPSYNPQHHQQQQASFEQQQPQQQQQQQPPLYYPQTQSEYQQQAQPPQQPQHPLLQQLEIPKPVYQLVTQESQTPSPSGSRTYQTPSPLQPTRLEIDEQKVLLTGPIGPPPSAAENVADGFQMQTVPPDYVPSGSSKP
ncbi:hypothetical protein QBC44DRAFT_284603 [Cladorrhinum sp. PSN332]|nr:hypothetical protein QBC44DRAFT_284603 [Cladorrhinum sp. PSN332]